MGVLVALVVFVLWLTHLLFILFYGNVDLLSPIYYLHILVQGYLFTGLFITAHDAMHGGVSHNRRLNDWIGRIATLSFAYLSYDRMRKNHYLHHQFPASENDPDFYVGSNNFFVWWFRFMLKYSTWWQYFLMAVTFNVLLIWFNQWTLISFWVIPAILGTFQLFYFGTFLPHQRPHTPEMGIHKSRTLPRNHFWAMLSCYFFGYHREHHETPTTQWWKLYAVKNNQKGDFNS